MKQNIFSKKNQLDEMQEQTLRKIESRGFWLMWCGLFVVMTFQLIMLMCGKEATTKIRQGQPVAIPRARGI